MGLGLMEEADKPTPIPALAGKRVEQLAVGGNHTFARMEDGRRFPCKPSRFFLHPLLTCSEVAALLLALIEPEYFIGEW